MIMDVDYARFSERFEGKITLKVKSTVFIPILGTIVTKLVLDPGVESSVTKKVNGVCQEEIVFTNLCAWDPTTTSSCP